MNEWVIPVLAGMIAGSITSLVKTTMMIYELKDRVRALEMKQAW